MCASITLGGCEGVFRCQIKIFPTEVPAITDLSSADTVTALNRYLIFPGTCNGTGGDDGLPRFQESSLLSSPPEYKVLPSLEITMALTASSCPLRIYGSLEIAESEL